MPPAVPRTLLLAFLAPAFATALSGAAQSPVPGPWLETLPLFKTYRAGRVSSYDRTGGNHDWVEIQPGQTLVLAELEGPGAVTHLWFTHLSPEKLIQRKLVLRMYWEGESDPSVECPFGDFFGLGHGQEYTYASGPFVVAPVNGCNSYWFMPFAKSARITLTHEGTEKLEKLYYQVDYRRYDPNDRVLKDVLGSMGRFHAAYHQEFPCPGDYVVLDARGRGTYAGCNLSVRSNSYGWWGEGDDTIVVDGDTTSALHGTGLEDYFGGAWGFRSPYSSLWLGNPLQDKTIPGGLWSAYRYHVPDPIPFQRSIRVSFEGFHDPGPFGKPADFSSVAYWYQEEPHATFQPLPAMEKRLPASRPTSFRIEGALEAEDLQVAERSTPQDVTDIIETYPAGPGWSNDKQLTFFPKNGAGAFFAVELTVATAGEYRLEIYPSQAPEYGTFQVELDGHRVTRVAVDGYAPQFRVPACKDLGIHRLTAGKHRLQFLVVGKNPQSSGYQVGIDAIRLAATKEKDSGDR